MNHKSQGRTLDNLCAKTGAPKVQIFQLYGEKNAAGGYGCYGTYTDVKRSVVMELNPDGTPNYDNGIPLSSKVSTTESYREYIGTADLILEIYGLTLQSEYIYRYVDFTKPGPLKMDQLFFSGYSVFDILYKGNYQGNGVYALLAWQLPLSEWLGSVLVTPYFMYEHGEPDDTATGTIMDLFHVGLNVKPSAFVTLKAEYGYTMPREDSLAKNMQSIFAQATVSF